MSDSGLSPSERENLRRLRELPQVEALLQSPFAVELSNTYGRPLTLEAVRSVLADLRAQILKGQSPDTAALLDREAILHQVSGRLQQWVKPSLVPVINASGVILHTNLGRAPLSKSAIQAVEDVSRSFSNLEFDLDRGVRGSRLIHAEDLLQRLVGAESALVVNNNAAAILLALTALARRKRVIISRTQLIEIGGGFRIPEVMSQSGAKLVEVGATNRVHLRDYAEALAEPAALVMRAHHSNFKIIGFTAEPSLQEMVQLAHEHSLPVLDDLGSGVLLDTAPFGLVHEPTVQESLAAGADLVCFSGDKLLGGPQAGIIVGRADLVTKLRKHPLARAVRADKLCLAALSATLQHYLKDEVVREVPVWRMIAQTPEQLYERACRWTSALGVGEVIPGQSTVGGGSLPGEVLPTSLVILPARQPNRLLASLRAGKPPVVARIETDRVALDPRTVLPEEEGALFSALRKVL